MTTPYRSFIIAVSVWLLLTAASGCGDSANATPGPAPDAQLAKLGTVEITARLVEVPDGAIFKRDLYDYATILKYEVVETHRGQLTKGAVIYVGQYNPIKPRAEAVDARVKVIGGNVREFSAGALHRMALEEPLEDNFLGGVVDKYFGKHTGVTYWAVWTNRAD